jgi:cytochrome c2
MPGPLSGTIMMGAAMTDAGLKNETQRADLMAYLATVK